MSMGRASGVVLIGTEGHMIEVEADISQTLPAFVLLGLPDASLKESQDRIRSAANNTGLALPPRKLTINLLPAPLRKSGSSLDLAILMSAWAADGHVTGTDGIVFLAELGLDGRLRPVRGVLPAVAAAVRAGLSRVVVSRGNAAEAALVPGAEILAGDHVAEVAHAFRSATWKPLPGGTPEPLDHQWGGSSSTQVTERLADRAPGEETAGADAGSPALPDLAEVHGQYEARFALEAAAAGGHHLLLVGPPGAGKTMMAERLPSILPPLDEEAAMEVTAIASITANAKTVTALQRTPPFESPHHSASSAAIVGGGSRVAAPGAVTRAHRGVLFLDEAPEHSRQVLDSLRQPLESGHVSLHRSAGSVSYPARFQLVMAANPCLCGMNTGAGTQCTCTVLQRRTYLSRISGPLLDRIDCQVQVERPRSVSQSLESSGEPSSAVLQRVMRARAAQRERLARWGLEMNSQVSLKLLSHGLRLPKESTGLLDEALDRADLSLRGYVRVLRLAWTISDITGEDRPGEEHIDAAMQLRQQLGGPA